MIFSSFMLRIQILAKHASFFHILIESLVNGFGLTIVILCLCSTHLFGRAIIAVG